MAAYGTDPRRYLRSHTSQLATKLSADGVDDCLVCSTLALVNGASIGGDPYPRRARALVRGARADRRRMDGLEILVDDPFRPGGRHLRGEWLPAKQVRQFAFRDSDSTLTTVWVEATAWLRAERSWRHHLAPLLEAA